MFPICFWSGLRFYIHPIGAYGFLSHGAVYILCRRNIDGTVDPLYVGQAGNLSQRLGRSHEYWQAALDLGFNELHLMFCGNDERARCRLESRVLANHPTPLNERVPSINTLADIFR
jgi:hypothetical protein